MASADDPPESVMEVAPAVTPGAVELRRLLHRRPEPAHQEHQTTALITASLDQAGSRYRDPRPTTGLWVDLGPPP